MKQLIWVLSVLFVLTQCNQGDDIVNVDENRIDSTIYIRLDSLNPDYVAVFDQSTGIYSTRLDTNIIGNRPDGDIFGFTYELSIPLGSVIEIESDTVYARVGANAIYPLGIDRALQNTNVGQNWKFVIPPSLAYLGYLGDNLIPPESFLELDVQIIEIVTSEELNTREFDFLTRYIQDTSNYPLSIRPQRIAIDGFTDIFKRIIIPGDTVVPSVGSIVSFTYEAKSLPDSLTFDVGELEILFEGGQVISGVYNALGTMQVGETAQILMPSSAGYSESARVFPNIVDDGNAYQSLQTFLLQKGNQIIPTYASKVSPYEVLSFEITLRSVE